MSTVRPGARAGTVRGMAPATAALRAAMVDALLTGQTLSAPVEQALRAVPRERFLPGVPLDQAYENTIVTTDRDADGTVLSCTTMPSGVADMLEQLDVRPGHRILEIGAGTGINAALLAHLAGPDGHVTTIDVLPAAADRARQHLAETGYGNVRVVTCDGALGYPPDAPYSRIIATAGAWDIPPAWTAQATPDARMVVPLRIGGFTHIVTLQRCSAEDGPVWSSVHSVLSGFIKMRGEGLHGERDVPVVAGGQSELRVEDGIAIDQAALVHATSGPPVHHWTGVQPGDLRLPGLEIWLASLGGLTRLINRRPGHGLAPAIGSGGSLAVLHHTGDTFAYLTSRDTGTGQELGICAYGPHTGELAGQVAGRLRAWHGEYPHVTTTISIYPRDTEIPASNVLLAVAKDHTQVIVQAHAR